MAARAHTDAVGEVTRARESLHAALVAALSDGLSVTAAAGMSGYTREHVRRIRDSAKSGGLTPGP